MIELIKMRLYYINESIVLFLTLNHKFPECGFTGKLDME